MRYLVLMGSPRKEGNTIQTLRPIVSHLQQAGHEVETLWLYDLDLRPCTACRVCQKDWTIFGCRFADDMQSIFDKIMACDCLILATPIYSFYCTGPLKNVLDRMVYGMNKYYGDERGPALWAGKPVFLVTTCGYPKEKGSDLFAEGMRRYCKHSALRLLDGISLHDPGYKRTFMTDEKMAQIEAFALRLEEQSREAVGR